MQQVQLLLIDEVNMEYRYLYECLDHSLQDVRGSNKLFGENHTLLILPVVKRRSLAQIIDESLKTSYIWEYIQMLESHLNHCVKL